MAAFKAIPLTSFDASKLSNEYLAINLNGLPNSCTMIRIINTSNVPVTISYDGITDNDVVINSLQIQAKEVGMFSQRTNLIPAGSKFFIKGTPGVGTIYLAGYYD